jgi:hypothetical protein
MKHENSVTNKNKIRKKIPQKRILHFFKARHHRCVLHILVNKININEVNI